VRHPPGLLLIPKSAGAPLAHRQYYVTAGWAALGLLVVVFAAGLTWLSQRFGYDTDVADMPVPTLVALLVAAGAVFALALPALIRATHPAQAPMVRLVTVGICVIGVAARIVLFGSEPMLEDDYQRYLWDGAVTAAGASPYAVAPYAARTLSPQTTQGRLAGEAGPLMRRINHPELTTLYPPVAQAAFVLAHLIRPFSLSAWRALILACDLATLALILALLRETGRSPLWSALYWWNPLVLKELFNSAHMDAVVMPLVLLGLLMAARQRQISAGLSLVLAAGAKIWPLLLLPLGLRPLLPRKATLALAMALCGGLLILLLVPILQSGLDTNSGLAAYAAGWHTNSALFPTLEGAVAVLLDPLGLAASSGLVTRAALALALGCVAITLAARPIAGGDDLLGRASLMVGALVLLSPAQFPWYAAWFAPFLAFRPWAGFLILTATAPLYYMSFYLSAAGEPELFRRAVVWLIWVPVWIALAVELFQHRTRTTTA
jgi:alpha-1,6-mannosyltransferase